MRKFVVRFLIWCIRPSEVELQQAIRAFVRKEIGPHLVEIQRDQDMLARAICAIEEATYDDAAPPPSASFLYKNRNVLKH
jgi:hypothetical protein